ncbi:MAG: LamG-like jellyroll fold domain-containing protein, partial [Phycisphaerales bacterium]
MKSRTLGLFIMAVALTLSANVLGDEFATSPSPSDGAANVDASVVLSWVPGDTAVVHYVYFGTDPNLVAAGDASVFKEMVMTASYTPADIAWEATYYWRIDEMAADGTMYAGAVWTFTVAPQVATSLEAWQKAAAVGAPGFFATNVEDGVYDIGAFGGEISYEFVVRSNPDEVEASMCLIGRRQSDSTNAGLKYEQWNNTLTYGATLFGVADYDYAVATNPGLPTHLVFVSSEETQTTALYVNGEYKASIAAAITLSGNVGIGYGSQVDAPGFFDNFDGDIFGVAIYDRALTNGEIRVRSDAYFVLGARDITAPGDAIQGIPNDGDWPGAETPNLAIDNSSATKFLHFKGETQTTGFVVTPALGATVVTGLTLTTANDAIERDPISFELYGSNDANSLAEAYVLIASGDVVDFNQADAWPRFTMNTTPITFANETAYLHYRVL